MAVITQFREKDQVLKFTLAGVDTSYANAIRRTLLSDVPCVMLHDCDISKNTTRLHNEILKQRIGCIPVYLDATKNYENLVVELEKSNTSQEVEYVTTSDFKIKDGDTYLSDREVRAIFPPDPYTHDHIDIVRLRPSITLSSVGETIKMTCKIGISTARTNGSYNVVSTCSYSFTPDPVRAEEEWRAKGIEDPVQKENWFLLDAKRFVIENSYDMVIESVGVYTNIDLLISACDILIKQLTDMSTASPPLVESDTTMANSYDLVMEVDYTIGNMLAYELYTHMFGKRLTYVTFYKKHPHDNTSILRVAFSEETAHEKVYEYLHSTCLMCVEVIQDIQTKIRSA